MYECGCTGAHTLHESVTLSHARWSIRSSVGAKGEAAWKEGTKAGVEGNEEEGERRKEPKERDGDDLV